MSPPISGMSSLLHAIGAIPNFTDINFLFVKIYLIMRLIKGKKIQLGVVGGGPKSWIGHVHRISSRFDNQYEIVAGVFSRNSKLSKLSLIHI